MSVVEYAPDVEVVLRRSGWFPNRSVEISGYKDRLPGFLWHEAAERFLEEFGGIRVDLQGPGRSVAKEPFEIDPELAVGEEGRFEELSQKFDRQLFPVGEFGQGEHFLAVDQESILYLVGSSVFQLGVSNEGIGKLVLGIQGARLEISNPDAV
ncbi:SUKH-3 domain-containing protein [Micromonospora sp. NPDC005174]|uniref:SUKH-3 domain-containing protein n=1 Tax=Micromonospora sp. NPDC005174 TaxID=3157018 RepID=UPI0033BE1B7E